MMKSTLSLSNGANDSSSTSAYARRYLRISYLPLPLVMLGLAGLSQRVAGGAYTFLMQRFPCSAALMSQLTVVLSIMVIGGRAEWCHAQTEQDRPLVPPGFLLNEAASKAIGAEWLRD